MLENMCKQTDGGTTFEEPPFFLLLGNPKHN